MWVNLPLDLRNSSAIASSRLTWTLLFTPLNNYCSLLFAMLSCVVSSYLTRWPAIQVMWKLHRISPSIRLSVRDLTLQQYTSKTLGLVSPTVGPDKGCQSVVTLFSPCFVVPKLSGAGAPHGRSATAGRPCSSAVIRAITRPLTKLTWFWRCKDTYLYNNISIYLHINTLKHTYRERERVLS